MKAFYKIILEQMENSIGFILEYLHVFMLKKQWL